MRVVREGTLYQLTFSNPEGLSVNSYLIDENDGLTLIDTAVTFAVPGILQVASEIGKPITKILLTHGHHDHTGGLDALKQVFPDARVYLSGREARVLAGETALDPGEPDTPIRGIFPKNLKRRDFILLREGDRIGSLLALAVPGHTPGSMAFLDTRNQAMIAGDALQTAGGIAVAGQLRPSFPYPAKGTWNNRVALESVRKLRGYLPALLAVGHGDLLHRPLVEIDRAIAEATENLQNETAGEVIVG